MARRRSINPDSGPKSLVSHLQIVYKPLDWLKPYERNPRKNDQAVDRMVQSIQEFGFTVPVLARSTGEVVDGHLRLKAALRLALREVPVILCDSWTEAQVKAFRLLVNRSVAWAEWDVEALAAEFADLKAMEFDLGKTGFDTREIDQFTLQANPAEDEVPPVPEAPVTRAGDLWLMGGHRLRCGDATNAGDVLAALGDSVPFLMVTDPPYGLDYDPTWRDGVGEFQDPVMRGQVESDDQNDWRAAYRLFLGDVAYVWHAGIFAGEVAAGLRPDFDIRGQIIWRKQHFAFGRGAYHWGHEPCWYAVRHGRSAHWRGDRKQSTVWDVANMNPMGGNDEERTGHGTQKPVEVMRRPILNHTQPGEAVYDPFLGSGTTLIAAELTERRCFGLEIDPAYVDVSVIRWQTLTGKCATLEGSGATFEQVKRGRQQEAEDALKEEALSG